MLNAKHPLSALLLFMAASGAAGHAAADVVVIVSAKSPVASLGAGQVSDIFLGKTGAFPGGGQAVPVDLPEGAAAREEFYGKATGKSQAQLKAYWSKIVFTGKGQPPKEVSDSAAVRRLVADNPNIVGYIDKGALDGSVKVVFSVR